VFRAACRRELRFERVELGPEDEPATLDDTGDRIANGSRIFARCEL
jgi:hypothetical protein